MHIRPPNKNRNNRNKSGRKPMGNVQNRVYESAGPEGKVRGTPQQIIEKYMILARDAQTSGDRVVAENFLQHAEHYIRMLNAAQTPGEERRPLPVFGMHARADYDDIDDMDDDGADQQGGDQQTGEQAAFGQQGPAQQPAAREGQRGEDGRQADQRHAERPDGERRRDRDERRGDRRPDDRRPEERRTDERRADERRAESRQDDAPRREGAARAEAVGFAGVAEAESSPLETIDPAADADVGLVATPESREPAAEKPPAEPRRRRRRVAPVETAAEAPEAAVAESAAEN